MPLDDAQNQEIEALYQKSLADKTSKVESSKLSDDKNQEIESLYQQSLKSGQGPQGIIETVKNWFTGAKSTEFPELGAFQPTNLFSKAYEGNKVGIGARLAIAGTALITPDLENQANVIKEQIPGTSISQDKFGNPLVIMPDGKIIYLNKPGADIEDITQLTSQLLQYGYGGGPIGKTFKDQLFKRALAQGAYGGALSAAQDVAVQPLGGEGVSYGRAAISAAIPFATEVALTPAVNAFFNKFGKNREFFTVDLNGNPTLTTKGEAAAKAAGIDVSNLDKATLNKKFTELSQRSESGNPAFNDFMQAFNNWKIKNPSAVSEKKFGINLTQAQQAEDKVGVSTLYAAAEGKYGTEVQLAARKFLDQQGIDLGNAAKDLVNRFNKGEIGLNDINSAGEKVISTIRNNFNKKSDEVKTAYNLVNNEAIYLGGKSNLDVLESSFEKALQEASGYSVDKNLTPSTVWLQGELKKFIDQIKSGSTIEGAGPGGKVQYVNPTNFNQFSMMRKKINSAYKAALPEGPDRTNIMALKAEFDKFTNDAIDNALFGSGENPLALEAVKKARQTFQEKQQTYGINKIVKNGVVINDPAGRVIQKIILDDTVTPKNAIDWIFGASEIGAQKDALQVVQRLKKVFGVEDLSKANGDFDSLKQAFVQRINQNAMDKTTNQFVPKKLVTQWNRALTKDKDLINELFTKEEQDYLTEFVNTVRKTMKPSERNLDQPIGLIDRILLSVGSIGAGNVGLQAGGSLYAGMAARGLWQRTVDLFHQGQAKRTVMNQLKQSPGALDELGNAIMPGKALADMFNKATGANVQVPSIGGTVGALANQKLNDIKLTNRPLISPQAVQQSIQKTNTPILNRNMFTPTGNTPAVNPNNLYEGSNILKRIDESNRLDQFIK